MQPVLEKLVFYLGFPFVVNALVVGTLTALCSALIGVPLVLKRFSFIGDGLSHTAFGALAVASVMQLSDNMFFVLAVTAAFSVLLFKTGENKKLNSDAATAMISVGALALGYLIMNIFAKTANLSGDVCTILFGSTSILTLRKTEVLLSIVLSVLVIVLFIVFYNKIFSVTFDESFSKGTGMNIALYNIIISSIIAVIIVLGMKLVGSLLISALLIFPPLSSMRICRSFRNVTICSAVIAVFCAVVGILAAVLAGTPVGSTVVAIDVAVYIICYIAGIVKR